MNSLLGLMPENNSLWLPELEPPWVQVSAMLDAELDPAGHRAAFQSLHHPKILIW